MVLEEARGGKDNKLELWGDAPRWEYSTAPLMAWDTGKPLAPPSAGSRGHALYLNDMQVSSTVWCRNIVLYHFARCILGRKVLALMRFWTIYLAYTVFKAMEHKVKHSSMCEKYAGISLMSCCKTYGISGRI